MFQQLDQNVARVLLEPRLQEILLLAIEINHRTETAQERFDHSANLLQEFQGALQVYLTGQNHASNLDDLIDKSKSSLAEVKSEWNGLSLTATELESNINDIMTKVLSGTVEIFESFANMVTTGIAIVVILFQLVIIKSSLKSRIAFSDMILIWMAFT